MLGAMRTSLWRTFLPTLLLFACALGCGSREAIGGQALAIVGPGVVNNPSNKSLRFDILKFGLERFCFEMTRRSAPLKLRDEQPVLGRFFAEKCQSQVLDDDHRKSIVVQYSGRGYGWTNLTGRIGFSAAGLVEYAPDFQLHEGALYVYFRPRTVDATQFSTLMVESALARTGMAVSGVKPDEIGQKIVQSQLKRGFTVIRYNDSGETDFGMGIIPKGQRPFHPFQIKSSERVAVANERTELHSGQQDYVGGFEITDEDQALYLTLSVDGAPAVDVFVIAKPVIDPMLDQYVRNPGAVSLNASPLLAEPALQGQLFQRYLPLPPGIYYLLLDHSPASGASAPPTQPADLPAKVDYLLQVGEVP